MTEPLAAFTLPVPPSTNALFTHRTGTRQRIKTDAYRAWITEAGWELARQGGTSIRGPVRIDIDMPFNRKRDIDNAIKPIADILVRYFLIEDDRWVDEYRVRRVPVTEPLTVSIWRLAEQAPRKKSGVTRQSIAVREMPL